VLEIVYLDSSALVKLVVDEPESWALADAVRDRILLSSDIARVELPRAVRRLGLVEVADRQVRQVLHRVDFHRVDRLILELAVKIDPPELRAMDAVHLATAASIPLLEAFVTYDRRLAIAAEGAGLRVSSPA
jgi:predicted nucleic acid-binding protein